MLMKIFSFLIFQILFCHSATESVERKYKYDVAICAIFQNEADYLKEWIEFHKLVGVEHFYLFNHLSTDNYKSVLAPYIKSGLVELIQWPYKADDIVTWNYIQCKAYNHALKLGFYKAKWIAFIDIDEFLFPVEVDTIQELLADYGKEKGLCVNWQTYGTSHVETIQQKELLIEKLILKAEVDYPKNFHIKSIVRPEYATKFINPHYCLFKPSFFAVNSDKEKIIGAFSPSVLIDKVRINHYWTRDEHYFFNFKIARQDEWGGVNYLKIKSELNVVADPAILKYEGLLKKKILR